MAATTEQPADQKRPRISTLLGLLAPLAVVGTIALWWLGSLPDEVHPEVGRVVFGNIPAPLIAVFYIAVAVFLALTIYLFAQRAASWERGTGDDRSRLMKQGVH